MRADYAWQDKIYFQPENYELSAQDSYGLLHMRAALQADSGWELALWGKNLTDEDYYVRGFGSFGNDPRKDYVTEPYYQFGEPRMVGVTASYTF